MAAYCFGCSHGPRPSRVHAMQVHGQAGFLSPSPCTVQSLTSPVAPYGLLCATALHCTGGLGPLWLALGQTAKPREGEGALRPGQLQPGQRVAVIRWEPRGHLLGSHGPPFGQPYFRSVVLNHQSIELHHLSYGAPHASGNLVAGEPWQH